MCQPKYWNKIYSEAPERNKDSETIVPLIGERSDFEVIRVDVVISGSIIQIAQKIKQAFDTLESYRDCDCTVSSGTCIKHLSSMNTFITHGAKSEVTVGRR